MNATTTTKTSPDLIIGLPFKIRNSYFERPYRGVIPWNNMFAYILEIETSKFCIGQKYVYKQSGIKYAPIILVVSLELRKLFGSLRFFDSEEIEATERSIDVSDLT